jgi:hypothetical protein
VVPLPPGHPDVVAFSGSVPPEDAGEAGLDGITSPVFVVRSTRAAPGSLPDPDGAPVVAAAGYRLWPGSVAHGSVLTGVEWRGRGLAKAVGAAAVADALANGLLPQWRARIEPSRRAAGALGFHELGTQLSLALDT